jgi:peptidoglycan hydrolase-like protein with peptidoglycan-binding domain
VILHEEQEMSASKEGAGMAAPDDAARPFDAAEAAVAQAVATQAGRGRRRSRSASDGAGLSGSAGLSDVVPETPFMGSMPSLGPLNAPVVMRALRIGSAGDLVRAWQSFLLGQEFDPGGLDGVFGEKTEAATRAFQMKHGLTVDGIAGRQTLLTAMQHGFELIEEPDQGMTGSNFPPRPGFPPLVGTLARQALFGAFDFVPEPRQGNRESIRILGSWTRDNIVMVPIPQLRAALGSGAPSGMRFHRHAAEQLKALWADWEEAGLLDRMVSFDGSFVPRFVRGSTTVLSTHAFGCAFDINARQNALGARPALVGERGCVRELVSFANRRGFYWGGHFGSRPDGMHFEVAFLQQTFDEDAVLASASAAMIDMES